MFNRLHRQSMRTRLVIFFMLMSIIPAAVLGVVSLRLFSRNLEQNESLNNQRTLEFMDYRLEQAVSEIHKAVLLVAYDDNIRSYFSEAAFLDAEAADLMRREAQRALIRLQLHQNAHAVMLVSPEGNALVYSRTDFAWVKALDAVDYPLLDEARFRTHAAWGKPFRMDGEWVVPYERIVLDPNGGEASRLVVFYPTMTFRNLFKRYEGEDTASFYVVDMDGAIIACSDDALVGRDAGDALGLRVSELSAVGSVHAEGFLCSYSVNRSDGFALVERQSLSVFTALFRPILFLLLGISAICLVACLVIGTLLSHAMTKPLYALINRVSNDPTSASHASSQQASGNEIAILSDRYDVVIRQLEASIADYYEEQRMKKEAEVRALEFQINPHFLYNTLSTIIWLIDAGESDRAIEITQALSSFFRISISKGREFICLRDEVRHVQLYMDIQKARYANISIEYDVPEALLDYVTPKLILQPLVENAILHGMEDSLDGVRIRISGRQEGEDILLCVEDDGAAATEADIEEMNRFLADRSSVSANRGYGIGISNVHDRIHMFFGDGYGLSYTRSEGRTHANLRIRARREE